MKRRRQMGFTLVELTVVMIIIALLIGGMLVPLSTQNDMRNQQETEKSLAEIKEALIGFAAVNGRLPCPARRSTASSGLNAGTEAVTAGACACVDGGMNGVADYTATQCNSAGGVVGALPWATLGLRETDAWGKRFTYRLTTRFGYTPATSPDLGCVPPAPPTLSAFALCSPGEMTVRLTSGGTSIAGTVPAVVISHGRNGLGGFMSTGLQGSLPASVDELENADDDADFVSKTPVGEGASVYDDLTVWVTTNILMSRMIAVGRLP